VKAKPVTVSEMAAMVGLSRSRFYSLVKAGVFPRPVYKMLDWHAAVYIEHMQMQCMQVRQTRIGINGRSLHFRSP
jgi:predicted DNA-binding transcriptional regulator AlpA